MIRQMGEEFTDMLMEHSMMENGKTTCSTAKESKPGQTRADTWATTQVAESMALALMNGMMAASMLVNGSRIRSLVVAFIAGSMGGCMKESGRTITWRDWDSTSGMMEGNMKATTKTIRNTGMVFMSGLMAESTKATGTEVSSTE